MSRDGGGEVVPWSARLCDVACIGFGLATLATHAVVALAGNLWHLLAAFAVAAMVAVFARRLLEPEVDPPRRVASEGRPAGSRALRIAGIAIGAVVTLRHARDPSPVLWWCASAAVLGSAALLSLGRALPDGEVETGAAPTAPSERRRECALWLLAAASVAVALVCHRPDRDDAFYVNVAVAVADQPERPLLSGDTMHAGEGLPLHMPLYRVHAYEVANGVLAFATGIPAIACIHWLSAALAALLLPLALARLFRLLVPEAWPWAVAFALAALLLAGETHRSWGNYGLVRIWQGKAILVSVVLPLVYAYAVRYALRPSARSWILLCACQIAGLGASAAAIWLLPLSAGLALLSATRFDRAGLRSAATGLLASSYPLAAGIAMRGGVALPVGEPSPGAALGAELARTLASVAGTGDFRVLALGTATLAWAALRPGLAQRFAIAVPLGALLFASPFWEDVVRTRVTGWHWRVAWALPFPILLGLALTAPIAWSSRGSKSGAHVSRAIAIALSLAATAALPFALRLRTTLDGANGAVSGFEIGWPHLKVEREAFRFAERSVDVLSPGTPILAPTAISAWLPTFHRAPRPIEVRPQYVRALAPALGREDAELRRMLTLYVSGVFPDGAPPRGERMRALREGLARYALGAVAVERSAPRELAEEVRGILGDAGFALRISDSRYELWTRAAPPP